MVNVFAVPIFFIVFRETLETAVVVSVLLAFLKQQLGPDRDPTVYKRLRKQVWLGTLTGFGICLLVGCGLIGAFYGLGKNNWQGAEAIWEGTFAIVASVIITIMGAALLRVSKMQDKWRTKLAKALEEKPQTNARFGQKFKRWCEKYVMFILPFITILREGLEAIMFVGGVSLALPASAIPLPTVCGLIAGSIIGFIIYKGGNAVPLQIFLIVSTCFLYLVAAGLFSRGIWFLEADEWNKITGGDAAETGSGAGSYDIRKSVWHVNCCNPQLNGGGGWGVFNALFGWQNSATYGSVIGYNVYWIVVIISFLVLRFKERRGRYPFMKAKAEQPVLERKTSDSDTTSQENEKAVVNKSKVTEISEA